MQTAPSAYWNVSDPVVLSALCQLRREDFVPEKYRAFAYADWAIPLSRGQSMLTPALEVKLLQALQLKKKDRVLEIGTGSGYFSALLGKLSREVLSVDLYREFSDQAALNTVSRGVHNISFETGDASRCWTSSNKAPALFDAIILSGSLSHFPETYLDLLAEGGRMVVAVGSAPVMQVIRVTAENLESRKFHRESLFDTVLPPLQCKKKEVLS